MSTLTFLELRLRLFCSAVLYPAVRYLAVLRSVFAFVKVNVFQELRLKLKLRLFLSCGPLSCSLLSSSSMSTSTFLGAKTKTKTKTKTFDLVLLSYFSLLLISSINLASSRPYLDFFTFLDNELLIVSNNLTFA